MKLKKFHFDTTATSNYIRKWSVRNLKLQTTTTKKKIATTLTFQFEMECSSHLPTFGGHIKYAGE